MLSGYWLKVLFLYTAMSHSDAKRPASGEYGLAAVPEYGAGTKDSQSNEMQLTVGTLYIHLRK